MWCMAWHVGRVDVAQYVCCHVHAICGGCGWACRAARRVLGLHRALCGAMCGAVTVSFAGVMGGRNVFVVHGMACGSCGCRTVCVLPCACNMWWLWLGMQGSTQGSGPAQGPVWGHVWGCDCVIRRRHGGSECVCGAWHGMWVVWMSHSMCAAMCMQYVVAVVGHAGQHAGFWACTGPCVGPCVGL